MYDILIPIAQVSSNSNVSMVVVSEPPPDQQQQTTVNFDPETKEEKKVNIFKVVIYNSLSLILLQSTLSRDLTPYRKQLHNKVKRWRASRDLLESEETDVSVKTTVSCGFCMC